MFQPILPEWVTVGKALIRDLFVRIKNNLDNHEERLNAIEFATAGNFIFNGDISLRGVGSSDLDVYYYKAPTNFLLGNVVGQLFSKESITSGTLSLDIQRATNTNPASFTSCLTSDLSYDFSSDSDFTERQATINTSAASFNQGDVLRVVFTSIPLNFGGKILIQLEAQV